MNFSGRAIFPFDLMVVLFDFHFVLFFTEDTLPDNRYPSFHEE